MTREIKFRYWDMLVGSNKMVYFSLLQTGEIADKILRLYPVMQFTGLKDKNGKEIYEGDIVKGWLPDENYDEGFDRMVIKYEGDSFSLHRLKEREFDVNEGLYFGNLEVCTINKSIEIIGNIYENELLNE